MQREGSGIAWTQQTWNPIRGCSRVSTGCTRCYAERIAARFSGPGEPYEGLAGWTKGREPRWTGQVRLVEERLEDPIRWKRPRMIFVNSMSDLFHEALQFDQIATVLNAMEDAPQHVYQILTKRADRMREFFESWIQAGKDVPGNWWIGVSAENQATAEARIPQLQNTPALVRWVSLEPLLGPITLGHEEPELGFVSWLAGIQGCDPPIDPIDWVVVGGESGPNARPMHPAWAKGLRDQCARSRTPFFFKQWGEWAPHTHNQRLGGGLFVKPDGSLGNQGDYWAGRAAAMNRVGKHAAGRMLDGYEWNCYPLSFQYLRAPATRPEAG